MSYVLQQMGYNLIYDLYSKITHKTYIFVYNTYIFCYILNNVIFYCLKCNKK